MNKITLATLTATLALSTSALAQEAMSNTINTDGVMVEGDTATIPSVSIDRDGYLVIHATLDGQPVVPASIGHTAIEAGEHSNVAVSIDYPFAEGENYIAMLHYETNDNTTYDFGEGSTDVDTPVVVDGSPVVSSFPGSGMMADAGANATTGDAAAMNSDAAAASDTSMNAEASAEQAGMDLETHISDWPQASREAANEMMQKYGAPDEMTDTLLIWRDNGPFVRTYVYGYEVDHNWPAPHKDVLEQFIHYDVPEDMFDELAMFDGSIIAERTKGEISARCHAEFANLIALNLAHDILEGNMSVEEARSAYVEAVRQQMAGNPPEIAQQLTFTPPSDVNNPGEAVITP
jgi:hypothetical protein